MLGAASLGKNENDEEDRESENILSIRRNCLRVIVVELLFHRCVSSSPMENVLKIESIRIDGFLPSSIYLQKQPKKIG